ncbi:MAG: haloacid dehalogenase-like hydrolase [Nitrospirota bacterium]|nr:haloacid dehalogenase-like hydrolase [Nitrospirota bacterium]MDE3036100.1 haloacid dehalogenase-like hydrolase [Nitrospirota bacterium]MDE3119100.1 haloacid dehalogenase-like hydrolase [Nitrospirota bacterium]MDE3244109.1 haloacid dehalogenase-like hydrolase [Nitrospirota bacterium]
MNRQPSAIGHAALDWSAVDDVLLDMDGTLLDRHFDNFFFEEELPRRYAARHGLPFAEALAKLLAMYRSVETELAWTDLHYWSRLLDMDLVALTKEFDHLIRFLPDAEDFLAHLREQGKRVHIVTNAHASGIAIKAAKTGVDKHVERIVNAFEIGYLKMRPEYWPTCRDLIGFDPARSLYIDDDESCLAAAQAFGIGHIVHRSKSSSQLPPQPSARYRSIETFHVLMG